MLHKDSSSKIESLWSQIQPDKTLWRAIGPYKRICDYQIVLIYLRVDMLLKQTHELKLKRQSQKILCFSSAFNGTYVFSQVIKPGETESIVHVNGEGEILFEHKYEDIINDFGMINEREVIVMDVPKSHIDIINLEDRKVRSIEHQYLFEDVAQMCIQTFYDTKMFCIVEKGTFNDHRLRLTYYDYNSTYEVEKCKPVCEWQS